MANSKIQKVIGFYTPTFDTEQLTSAFVTYLNTATKECLELYDIEKIQQPL